MKLLTTITLCFLLMPYLSAGGQSHENIEPSHGGYIFEVGNHVAFIELVHDVVAGKMILYVLDHNNKPLGIKNAPRINLFIKIDNKEVKKQFITKALNLKNGMSHEFEARDSVLADKKLKGKISIKIKDKIYHVEPNAHKGHEH